MVFLSPHLLIGDKYLPILVMVPNFWTVTSPLPVPADPSHSTSVSERFFILTFYVASESHVLPAFLVVFSFSLCLVSCYVLPMGLAGSAALPAS